MWFIFRLLGRPMIVCGTRVALENARLWRWEKVAAKKTVSGEKLRELYGIDKLAQLTKVPSRTIRFYTQEGLLPPPVLKGRTGYYTEFHRKRLLQIKELKEEHYLPLKAIKTMLEREARGEDIEIQLVTARKLFRPLVPTAKKRSLGTEELAADTGLTVENVEAIRREGLLFEDRPDHPQKPFSEDNLLILRMVKKALDLGITPGFLRQYYSYLRELVGVEMAAADEASQGMRDELKHNPEMQDKLLQTHLALIELSDSFLAVAHRKMLQDKAKEYLSKQE